MSTLEKHSPGLQGFNWDAYLRCSVTRMVRVLRALRQHVAKPARILDFGSYFGNFAMACRQSGYDVDAADFYGENSKVFDATLSRFTQQGIRTLDFREVGPELQTVKNDSYDAILCMGVIEHIPHTPRLMLKGLDRALKPAGILILDTPNLAYVYKRKQLMRGESVYPAITAQFVAEVPFAGHHREYTAKELQWMLGEMGHEIISLEMFSHSIYSLDYLENEDLENYRVMESDPSSRELMISVSRRIK